MTTHVFGEVSPLYSFYMKSSVGFTKHSKYRTFCFSLVGRLHLEHIQLSFCHEDIYPKLNNPQTNSKKDIGNECRDLRDVI